MEDLAELLKWLMELVSGPLFSGLIAAVVAGAVSYAVAVRGVHARQVITERRKWRDTIRTLSIEAASMIRDGKQDSDRFRDIVNEFRIRLNPNDEFDNEILCIMALPSDTTGRYQSNVFMESVARLLKHDWERVKIEASWRSWRKVNVYEYRTHLLPNYLLNFAPPKGHRCKHHRPDEA